MRSHYRLGILALLSLALGCGSDGVAPTGKPSGASAPLTTPARNANASPTVAPANKAGAAQQPGQGGLDAWAAVPNARWTLFVMRLAGPGHVKEARLYRERLEKQTGRNEWVVVHEENQSVIYFGAYRELDPQVDPAEGGRAQRDLKWFAGMVDAGTGRRVFGGVMAQPIPLPDPAAPAEWNLANVDRDKEPTDPNRRYWSLVVAGYNLPGEHGESRKQLAVDVVRDLREKLKIEAYYYHGPSVSHVCIGAWKRSAVEEQDSNTARAGNPHDSVVVSPAQLPDSLVKDIESHGDTQVQMPKVVVLDNAMKATMRDERFRHYALNGYVVVNRITDPRTRVEESKPQPSFLVEIAGVQKSLISGNTVNGQPNRNEPPSLLDPVKTPGSGLRQLGQ